MVRLLTLLLSPTAEAADPPAGAPTAPVEEAAPAAPPADPAPTGPFDYRLDPKKSWLFVVVYNDPAGLASKFGHDHGVRATDFDGRVTWDPADASKCDVSISFPVTALRADPPGLRERAGLDADGAVSDGSLETIRNNFLGKGQLDASAFPTISYRSTRCEGTTGRVVVTGELTIHGVSKPVTVTLDVSADAQGFSAKGGFTATHTDFGFKPFSNLGGALKNKDELRFVIDVTGPRS